LQLQHDGRLHRIAIPVDGDLSGHAREVSGLRNRVAQLEFLGSYRAFDSIG
jgi:hypothetical protein